MARLFIVLLSLLLVAAAPPPAPGQGYLKTSDGVRLFYRVVGRGPETLVAVHGGPGNSLASIEPDFRPFEKRFTIIYYDQRGNGYSDLIDDTPRLTL
ncbi:MAG TPA: hypothetical protein VEW26_11415, partial [Allosphingosinicella sp.]|nr:hypothetical protein [Allosphingosinicella sp.]